MVCAISAKCAPRVSHHVTVYAITWHRCTPQSDPSPASAAIGASCCAPNWSHTPACTRAKRSHASSTAVSARKRGPPSPIYAHTCARTIRTCRSDPSNVTSATRRSSRAVTSAHIIWFTRARNPLPAPTATSPIRAWVIWIIIWCDNMRTYSRNSWNWSIPAARTSRARAMEYSPVLGTLRKRKLHCKSQIEYCYIFLLKISQRI